MITLETTPDRVTVFRGHVRIADMAPSAARELLQALQALYPPEPFSLQLGGRYRARSGHTYGPLIHNPDSDYPFTTTHGEASWSKQGHYISERHVDTLDLIEMITS